MKAIGDSHIVEASKTMSSKMELLKRGWLFKYSSFVVMAMVPVCCVSAYIPS